MWTESLGANVLLERHLFVRFPSQGQNEGVFLRNTQWDICPPSQCSDRCDAREEEKVGSSAQQRKSGAQAQGEMIPRDKPGARTYTKDLMKEEPEQSRSPGDLHWQQGTTGKGRERQEWTTRDAVGAGSFNSLHTVCEFWRSWRVSSANRQPLP